MPARGAPAPVAPAKPDRALRIRQRQKLIEACITALHQHGPSRTTIDKVVTIADMSPGIVNFYFETKAALLVAALDFLATEFEDRVLTPLAGLADNPVQGLQLLIALYLDPGISSPRKVSVWYAFWGEATSRAEYLAICGKRDQAFADLVRAMMARLIDQVGAVHLDADAVALGLIGALELMWQEIAFQDEEQLDRPAAARRCMAYLRSIFPAQFPQPAGRARRPCAALRGRRAGTAPAPAAPDLHREACKALLAAELNFAGVPAICTPPSWTGCDVLARPANRPPQTIRIVSASDLKAASPVPEGSEAFDFLAVLLTSSAAAAPRRWLLIPRSQLPLAADALEGADTRYEANFSLHG